MSTGTGPSKTAAKKTWTLWCGGGVTFFCQVEAGSREEAIEKCEAENFLKDRHGQKKEWRLSDVPEPDGVIVDVTEDRVTSC